MIGGEKCHIEKKHFNQTEKTDFLASKLIPRIRQKSNKHFVWTELFCIQNWYKFGEVWKGFWFYLNGQNK